MQSPIFSFYLFFHLGLDDQGNSNFFQYVVMNKPSGVKSILVMEDLSDWKVKIVGTMLSQNEIILCLKNIACMHARFWGEKKKDIEEFLRYVFYRSTIYSSDIISGLSSKLNSISIYLQHTYGPC